MRKGDLGGLVYCSTKAFWGWWAWCVSMRGTGSRDMYCSTGYIRKAEGREDDI